MLIPQPPKTLFLLVNVAYFVVLDKVDRTSMLCATCVFVFTIYLPQVTVGSSNTVALDFGRAIFGRVGGIVFAGMVAFSCFGALNGQLHPHLSCNLMHYATKSLR